MNTGAFTSEFQQQAHFISPNASYYHQTTGYGAALGTQTTHIGAPRQNAAQPPGTYQLPSQHPRTNQQFTQHPGTNPFLAQHLGTTHCPIQHSGTNQNPTQYPGTSLFSTLHPGQCQFRGTSQHTETSNFLRPPLFKGTTPYLGNHFQQPFPQRMPFPAPQFQQTATQSNNGTQYASGNAWQSQWPVFSATNQYNFQFANPISSGAQTQTSNGFQFVGTNTMKSEPAVESQNNVMAGKISLNPVVDKSQAPGQEACANVVREEKKDQTTAEVTQAEELQRRLTERDRIVNLIRIQHLISSYVKVRNLSALCRDFETPVFGDLPEGNEVEKSIVRNLSHFLKEEIQKIRFVDLEERGQIKFGIFDRDPLLRASFPVIKTTIMRLELKKNDVEKEKKKLETLEKEITDFLEELKLKEGDSKTLKSEVEAEKARIEKLKERLKEERKNSESIRYQFGKEMEHIDNIQIHGLHEDLRALQEKISKERKDFNQKKDELKNLKEQNSSLRVRISETERKIDKPLTRPLKKEPGQSTCTHTSQNNAEGSQAGSYQLSRAQNGHFVM